MAFPFLSSIINNARLIDARRREKTTAAAAANVNVVGQKKEERASLVTSI